MKLYTSLFSPNARKLHAVAKELGIEQAQRLSRPLVRLKNSPIQVCLRTNGQVGAFREVLADGAVPNCVN
jgi:hypothetical protein